jgi:hypothetical protein
VKRGAPLKRKSPLQARKGLSRSGSLARVTRELSARDASLRSSRAANRRISRERARRAEPGYAEWHAPIRGECAVCKKPGPLERHHAVQESYIRRHGGDPWDLRWSLELGKRCRCHGGHHVFGVRDARLDFKHVPAEAVSLAREVMGEGPAEIYFKRHYKNVPDSTKEEKDGDVPPPAQ